MGEVRLKKKKMTGSPTDNKEEIVKVQLVRDQL
jgi:hypothetical protein